MPASETKTCGYIPRAGEVTDGIFQPASCIDVVVVVQLLSRVPQAPLPMGFPRQKYWSGLPCPSPDLPD